jgi:hypothetical protein
MVQSLTVDLLLAESLKVQSLMADTSMAELLDTLVLLPDLSVAETVDAVQATAHCEHLSLSFAACSVAAVAVVQPKLLAADALAVDATKHS